MPPPNFSSENGEDEGKQQQVCVGWLLLRRVCAASRKQKHIKQNTERCLLLKKFLVSRNEPRELENIDARDFNVSIAKFLLQVRN